MNPQAESPELRYPLLDRVQSPADLKSLAREELPDYCGELRSFLLESVQSTGGHLGSNLGVVEIAAALHYVFESPRDRIIWDVSHQCYPHKVITGRREQFGQLRRTGGLCGFTHPAESPCDLFHTGHAGTSISLGLGLATGNSQEGGHRSVISVIGDASLGAGVAFEGLNQAAASGEKLIVVLNDNEWSISKSVGALAKYLSRIRSARLVQRAQQEIHGLLQSIPVIGGKVEATIDQLREVLRHTIVTGHVFEELGVTYVGPVNGHDVGYLVENFERIRELDGVVLLHTLTEKGKGHPNAPTHDERVHAVKAAKPAKKVIARETKVEPAPKAPAPAGPSFTAAFGESVCAAADRDIRVNTITCGMPSGTGLLEFAERFPKRFHDAGITEQHGVALAAGMAKAGLRPVAAIYSTFLQRAYDQVFQEVALQNLPVVFCMDRAGLVGQDGPTHNGVFDTAYLRTLPNMTLVAPRDASDMRRMLDWALAQDGPVGLRYPRDNCPVNERISESERRPLEPGTAEVLAEGDEVCLWGFGAILTQVLEAADQLAARGVQVGVVDARFAKPLDADLLAQHAKRYRQIITIEEHQRAGGFGSAVLEALSRTPNAVARVRCLAIGDHYIDHMTTREEQLAETGLDAASIERAVVHAVRASLV